MSTHAFHGIQLIPCPTHIAASSLYAQHAAHSIVLRFAQRMCTWLGKHRWGLLGNIPSPEKRTSEKRHACNTHTKPAVCKKSTRQTCTVCVMCSQRCNSNMERCRSFSHLGLMYKQYTTRRLQAERFDMLRSLYETNIFIQFTPRAYMECYGICLHVTRHASTRATACEWCYVYRSPSRAPG